MLESYGCVDYTLRNTAFFHKSINFRKHYNAIQGIFIEDIWVQQPKLVKDKAVKFFASRFTEEKLTRPTLDGVQFNMITHTQREELTPTNTVSSAYCRMFIGSFYFPTR